MNDVFELLLQRLNSIPDLRVEKEIGLLKVLPQYGDGFTVSLEERTFSYIVRFDSWSLGFKKDEDSIPSVINLFLFGLSPKCRVKVYKNEALEYQWDVEYWWDDEWANASSMRRSFSFSKIQPEIQYYQNNFSNVGDLTGQFLTIINESKRLGANFVYTIISILIIGICIKKFPSTVMLFPGYIIAWVMIKIAIDSWFDKRIKKIANHFIETPIRFTTAHYCVVSWIGLCFLAILGLRWKYGNEALILCFWFWPFLLILFLLPIFYVLNGIRKQ